MEPSQNSLQLTLVIPAYNAAATLPTCLEAVFQSTVLPTVIVVDDGSSDETARIAARFPCQILSLPHNHGAAAARNAGANLSAADILFFLDGDIVLERNTVCQILETFREDASLAALFGSYQLDTVPQNFVSQYKNLLHHYTHQHADANAATFCGGYGAVRREIFCALRGFDESQRALEDIEFGYRLHRAGYRIRLCKDLQFSHLKHYTLAGLVRSDVRNRAIPWTKLMLKNHIFRNDLNTRTNNVLSVIVAFLLLGALFWFWVVPLAWVAVLSLVGLFFFLNLDFILFVTHARGIWFGARTLAMLWFNYLYSGIGLVLGIGAYFKARLLARA